MRRSTALILAISVAPVVAASGAAEEPGAVGVALGVKAGFIPPVLATPELVLHFPHFWLGAFGIRTNGGLGNGAGRLTLGGELGYEFKPPGESTPYLLGSFFHYSADTDASGFHES